MQRGYSCEHCFFNWVRYFTTFAAIQLIVENRTPKKAEWATAFGLFFTISWLIMELLSAGRRRVDSWRRVVVSDAADLLAISGSKFIFP